MRKIVILSFISLDGVMQAPGGPNEDTSGGFEYGGWTVPYWDEFSSKAMDEQIGESTDLLLGRKTYDIFASYWPKQAGKIADPFNNATKYVVSSSSPELTWEKSVLIDGDVVTRLKMLKESEGPMLQVHGSSNMIQTLLKNDLVDEVWLKIFPLTLGSGKRLFEEGAIPLAFKLIESKISPKGVIYANYVRSGAAETGSFD